MILGNVCTRDHVDFVVLKNRTDQEDVDWEDREKSGEIHKIMEI